MPPSRHQVGVDIKLLFEFAGHLLWAGRRIRWRGLVRLGIGKGPYGAVLADGQRACPKEQ
jgi:hypothetical protein